MALRSRLDRRPGPHRGVLRGEGRGLLRVDVEDDKDRAPITVKRIERMLLTGQLAAPYDAGDGGVDFDATYGAPRDRSYLNEC